MPDASADLEDPPRQLRRQILVLAKVAVSLGLLAWLGARIVQRDGVDALFDRLGALDPGWLAVAIALHALAVFAGVLRWRLLARAAGVELSLGWMTRSFLIGRFVGAFTPSTTGLDGWRIWEAGKASGAMGRSAAAIVVEKLVGLIGMALVCAALVPFGGAALLGHGAIAVALAMAGAAATGLALIQRPAWLSALAARLPKPVRGRATKAVEALAETELDAGHLTRAVGLGILSHLALSAVFWATAGALGVGVSGWTLLAVGNAIVLAVLLPVSVGGVGVRESVAVVLLATVGVASTDAALIALLGYLTGQVPALAGGLLMLARKSAPPAPIALVEQTLS